MAFHGISRPPEAAGDKEPRKKVKSSDIQDLLLANISPRAAWAGIDNEHVVRREISRELAWA